MENQDYLKQNKQLWNQRTAIHFKSDFYDVDGFIKSRNSLNQIERGLLGDLSGKSILHLQCHFGMDTLSLANAGAMVTGIDLSDVAIEKAKELNQKLNLHAEFICCNVYEVPEVVNKQFDIVFTSYGTIGWLPDLNKWATVISKSLKPGGLFLIVEFHPVLWMFDDNIKEIKYAYFKKDKIIETETGTYADKNAAIENNISVTWNHSLDEVISALMHAGLKIELFKEYDYSPYNIFLNGVESAKGKFMVRDLEGKLPLVYAVKARK